LSSKTVVVLAVAFFIVGILICSSVTKSEAVPRSGTDKEGMECETNPVLGADGTQTGLSVFSCCWHEYVTTASGRVDNGEWCQDCNLGYNGNVQSCGDEYPARKFSPPGGSVIGHLPTENAPPNNNNNTTGLSHGGIISVPPGITNSLPTSNSNGNGTGSSTTSHHSSNHHNKGGNQGQESGSIEDSSSKGGSSSSSNGGNSNSNDKSKSNSKDNSGH
jgi:uncharacterized membrane protein YgcG